MPLPPLGVQSWCFRHFTSIATLLPQLQSLGLTEIELCDVHLDWASHATLTHLLASLRAASIAISSIGVQYFHATAAHADAEEKWFAFAKSAGARLLTVSFAPPDFAAPLDAFRRAEAFAEKYDLRIAIHNHGGYNWLGNSQMIRHVLAHTSPRVGLCLDTAWCIQAGEDPLKWADEFAARLFAVHLKDFAFDRTGKWQDVLLGEGALDLHAFLRLAAAAPSLQTLTIEYEGDVHNPLPALEQCVARVRAALP